MIDVFGQFVDYAWLFVTRGWSAIAVVSFACTIGRRTDALRRTFARILHLAHRPAWQAALLAAAISLAVSLGVFWRRGEPLPHSPDEYATLLVADTLSHGRLANPPPELWPHFEAQIVLVRPSYASAYPLGNGLMLLFGRLLLGLEIAGVWLASAAAAAIAVWAARACLPPSWSFLAGLLIALHPTFTWWNIGYMGGSLAACGAGLLIGAALRLVQRPTSSTAAIAAAGVAILIHTRPWEGLFFTAGVALLAAWEMRSRLSVLLRRSMAALSLLAAALVLVALHNRAVTGSVTTFPHQEFDHQYQVVPNFLWETLRPEPEYRTAEMREAYARTYRTHYDRIHDPGGRIEVLVVSKLSRIQEFLVPWRRNPHPGIIEAIHPLFFVPLLLLPWSLRRRRTRRLLFITLISLVAPFAMTWWVSSQYLAPMAILLAILYVSLARELVARAPRAGSAIVIALLFFGIAYGIGAARVIAEIPQPAVEKRRQQIIRALEDRGGRHLVFVPESARIVLANRADLESAAVVWARERSAAEDAALVRELGGRTVWRVVGGRESFRVVRR